MARSPPPRSCLEAKDVRHGYEVTTPAHVWLSFNWLTHQRTPDDVLTEFHALAAAALRTALDAQARNAKAFFERQGSGRAEYHEGQVLTYAELYQLALSHGGEAAVARPEGARPVAGKRRRPAIDHPPDRCGNARRSRPRRPAGDHRFLDAALSARAFWTAPQTTAKHSNTTIMAAATACAKRHKTSIKPKQFFAGISDMSFFGHRPATEQTQLLSGNTPCSAFVDQAPDGLLSYPVVNIGPWGRDYHQKWEARVHMPYTFEILPDIIYEAAIARLSEKD